MINDLIAIKAKIDAIKKQVQIFKNAYDTCIAKGAASHTEFYKRSLVKLLQIQCELIAQEVLLEMHEEPRTVEALDIMGVDWIAHDGLIYITPQL